MKKQTASLITTIFKPSSGCSATAAQWCLVNPIHLLEIFFFLTFHYLIFMQSYTTILSTHSNPNPPVPPSLLCTRHHPGGAQAPSRHLLHPPLTPPAHRRHLRPRRFLCATVRRCVLHAPLSLPPGLFHHRRRKW